jgi:hypothetical protein
LGGSGKTGEINPTSRVTRKILVTNANHRTVRGLYRGLGLMLSIERHSVLAADPDDRGATTELAVVINYDPNI